MNASVVVPTYNEAQNIKQVIEQISRAQDIEIVVVDDKSPDGTADIAKKLSKKHNVKVLERPSKMGLSSAILDGFRAASHDIVGVIDADLQHPTDIIPRLIEPIRDKKAQVVFASRKVEGGGFGDWPAWRRAVSWGAAFLARPLTQVKDPLSGFFFMDKSIIRGIDLDAIGFKIGLEILVKCEYDRVLEVPYEFGPRQRGSSKLGGGEFKAYIRHLIRLYRYRVGI